MVTQSEASRDLRTADRIIVPFVSDEIATTTGFAHISRRDELHAWVETGIELALVVAGVAGVLAGVATERTATPHAPTPPRPHAPTPPRPHAPT
jgi:hypothetical protein